MSECVCCDLSAVAAAALVIQLGMDFMMDSYLGLFSLRVAEREIEMQVQIGAPKHCRTKLYDCRTILVVVVVYRQTD